MILIKKDFCFNFGQHLELLFVHHLVNLFIEILPFTGDPILSHTQEALELKQYHEWHNK